MASKYAFNAGLKELRFLFCQTSEHSAATRNFLQRSYPTMKKHNPHTPILIREASGFEPTLFARYSTLHSETDERNYGKETKVPLKGLDDKSIEQKVTELVQASTA